jgi:cob(I)alamin adenosyltransferase
MTQKGYIHIYTGNGKGKTTAAFGLAVRAHYAGFSIYIGQFVKSMQYHEVQIADQLPNICIEQLGRGCFINEDPQQEDIDLAQQNFKKCADYIQEGRYDMIILDELFIAIYFKLLSEEQVLEVLKHKAPQVELVLTGRYAPQSIIEFADLVTEMQEIKHYYEQGVEARDGIER